MCNYKNHYRPKKWYGHGRTGRTADDGPDTLSLVKQPNWRKT